MKTRIKSFLKKVFSIIMKPVMSILPGQLAFSFVLSIIPILTIIGIICIMFSISIDTLAAFVKDSFPPAISNMLLPLINGKGFDASIIVYLISALFLASGGAHSIIVTSDVLYNIKQPNFVRRRVKAFIITFILLTLVCFLLLVPGFGDQIILFLKSTKAIRPISSEIMLLYQILKYPLSFILIYFNIKLIYTIAPDKNIKSNSVTIGSLFTTILWILLTRFYSYYVSHLVHYDIFYGSLSNIIILLLWMYLLSFIFVVGLALNAEESMQRE